MKTIIENLKNKIEAAEKSNLCVGDSYRDNAIYKNGYIAGLKLALAEVELTIKTETIKDYEGKIITEAEKEARRESYENETLVGDEVAVSFYRKPCDLSTVKKYVDECESEESIVEKVVLLKNDNFESLTFDFFRNCDHIISDSLGNRIGGFNRDGLVRCVCVVNKDTDEKIFINCEGYDYARYVGLEK